jgi:hypothetical protein
MSEPRRLHEQTESSLESMLLEAGTAYRSSAAMRAKTLAALGLAGSADCTRVARPWLSLRRLTASVVPSGRKHHPLAPRR